MITQEQRQELGARPRAPRFGDAPGCVKVGQYRRAMPVTMARMMENALDWEHLPTLHASSFASIDLIDSGPWGWQAEAELPAPDGTPSGHKQLIELLVNTKAHHWVTTILGGAGEGNQIHTQAVMLDDGDLEVRVDFFVPDSGLSDDQCRQYGDVLSTIYAQLYDEDESMMARRQSEMQAWSAHRKQKADPEIDRDLGPVDGVRASAPHIVPFNGGRFKLDWDGECFTVFSVRCPHMLGPLDDAPVEGGVVTCPWHGYRFDVASGGCLEHPGMRLETPPDVVVTGGRVVLRKPA